MQSSLVYILTFLFALLAFVGAQQAAHAQVPMAVMMPLEHWKHPRQFRMDIYSRPYLRGTAQHLRTSDGGSTPCWNLQSRHVGSLEVNDPFVKISFFRSPDCRGAPTTVFRGSRSRVHNNVMIKARSVSVTKLRPVLLAEAEDEA